MNKLSFLFLLFILFVISACDIDRNGSVDIVFDSINQSTSNLQIDSCIAYPHLVSIEFERNSTSTSTTISRLDPKLNFLESKRYGSTDNMDANKYKKSNLDIQFSKTNPQLGIYLEGTYFNKRIQLSFFEDRTISFTGPGCNITDGGRATMLTSINFETLFSTITEEDLNNAVVSGNVILIAADPNLFLYNKILNQLDKSFTISFR